MVQAMTVLIAYFSSAEAAEFDWMHEPMFVCNRCGGRTARSDTETRIGCLRCDMGVAPLSVGVEIGELRERVKWLERGGKNKPSESEVPDAIAMEVAKKARRVARAYQVYDTDKRTAGVTAQAVSLDELGRAVAELDRALPLLLKQESFGG